MNKVTVPLRSNFFSGKFWPLAPICFAGMIAFMLQVIFDSLECWVPLTPQVAKSQVSSTDVLVRPFAWMSSALVVSILFSATILASFFAIWKTRKANGCRWTWQTACLIFILAGITGIAGAYKASFPIPLLERQVQIFDYAFSGFTRPGSTFVLDVLAIWESIMITIAFAGLNARIKVPEADWDDGAVKEQIELRTKLATDLLYLGAVTLAVGVVQFNLLLRLPGTSDKRLNLSTAEIDALANGLSMYAGTFFTLLLAALFVPTIVHWKGYTEEFAKSIGLRGRQERDTWMKNSGFAITGFEQLIKIFAVLAPILTGWLGEPLVKAISSL